MNIALLRQLRDAAGGYVPLGALGPAEGPGGVSGDLDELAAFGFQLERHPYLGAAYRGPAGRLCPEQIEFQLETRRVGRRVAVWNRVASTNDLAAQAAASSANDGLVVLAEEQSAGRGSRGRRWSAPAGSSILMSVLLFPEGPLAEPPWLTALAAVSVAEIVSEWTGRGAKIKWPNDVRVDGRKVAGILVERGAGAVIGIGVNANLEPDALPEELQDTATSLRQVLGAAVDRSELARDLIRRLDAHYDQSRRDGAATLNVPWRARSEHIGRPVRVATLRGTLLGRLDDLDLFEGITLTDPRGVTTRLPTSHALSITSADLE